MLVGYRDLRTILLWSGSHRAASICGTRRAAAGITPRYCSSNFAIETAIERRLACDHQDDAHHLRLHQEAHMVEAG